MLIAAVNAIFDFLFSLLTLLPIAAALVVGAIIFGIVLVPIYGKVSPQQLIARTKKRIFAALYESVIFRRNTGLSLMAQAKMFAQGLVYFLAAVPPILILAVPCIIALAQFNLLFGVRGVVPQEPVIINAEVSPQSDIKSVVLEVPPSVSVSPPVRDIEQHQLTWRVIVPADQKESLPLTIRSGSNSATVNLAVGEPDSKIYFSNSQVWWKKFLYSSGMKNPDWLTDFEIGYPARTIAVAGISIDWLVVFLVFSIASGFAASKFFGVEV